MHTHLRTLTRPHDRRAHGMATDNHTSRYGPHFFMHATIFDSYHMQRS